MPRIHYSTTYRDPSHSFYHRCRHRVSGIFKKIPLTRRELFTSRAFPALLFGPLAQFPPVYRPLREHPFAGTRAFDLPDVSSLPPSLPHQPSILIHDLATAYDARTNANERLLLLRFEFPISDPRLFPPCEMTSSVCAGDTDTPVTLEIPTHSLFRPGMIYSPP